MNYEELWQKMKFKVWLQSNLLLLLTCLGVVGGVVVGFVMRTIKPSKLGEPSIEINLILQFL